jgi:hypothetical protein
MFQKRFPRLGFLLALLITFIFPAGPTYLPHKGREFPATAVTALRLVDHVGGSARAVAVQGNHAYAGFGNEFAIVDVTDPVQPRRVSQLLLPADITRITLGGYYAFVAAQETLWVIDINFLAYPRPAAALVFADAIEDLVIVGRYLYLATGDSGVQVLDVADPVHLSQVSAYPTLVAAEALYAWQGMLLVIESKPGHQSYLTILDMVDPSLPALVSRIEVDDARGAVVKGDYAYVGTSSDRINDVVHLRVFDLSNLSAPVEVNDLAFGYLNSYVARIALAGNLIYYASILNIDVFDITDPVNPVQLSYNGLLTYDGLEQSGNPDRYDVPVTFAPDQILSSRELGYFDLTVSENDIYAARGESGLEIMDVAEPSIPRLIGHLGSFLGGANITMADGNAFLKDAYYDGHLIVADFHDPYAPTIGHTSLSAGEQVIIAGQYAYVWIRNDDYFFEPPGLHILDISSPTAPVEAGVYETVYGWHFTLSGDYAYLTLTDLSTGVERIDILDVSHPEQPVVAGTLVPEGEGPFAGITADSRYLYVGYIGLNPDDLVDLLIYDLTDPIAPTLAGTLNLAYCSGMADMQVSGGYLYLACGAGLDIVGVSTPETPAEVGTFCCDTVSRLAIKDHEAYLVIPAYLANAGLRVVDVSDSADPALLASYPLPAGFTDVTVEGEDIYALTELNGLYVFRLVAQSPQAYFPLIER